MEKVIGVYHILDKNIDNGEKTDEALKDILEEADNI